VCDFWLVATTWPPWHPRGRPLERKSGAGCLSPVHPSLYLSVSASRVSSTYLKRSWASLLCSIPYPKVESCGPCLNSWGAVNMANTIQGRRSPSIYIFTSSFFGPLENNRLELRRPRSIPQFYLRHPRQSRSPLAGRKCRPPLATRLPSSFYLKHPRFPAGIVS
jgi:hypothetical protein